MSPSRAQESKRQTGNAGPPDVERSPQRPDQRPDAKPAKKKDGGVSWPDEETPERSGVDTLNPRP